MDQLQHAVDTDYEDFRVEGAPARV
jgi:hypothetical protein